MNKLHHKKLLPASYGKMYLCLWSVTYKNDNFHIRLVLTLFPTFPRVHLWIHARFIHTHLWCICACMSGVCPCCSYINDAEKYPCCCSDNSTNIVSCICEVSSRANCMTDGGPIDCSQSSGLPAKIGPLAKSSLAQLICHQAGQSRLHKLHRPTKLTRCVLKPVLPSPTVH